MNNYRVSQVSNGFNVEVQVNSQEWAYVAGPFDTERQAENARCRRITHEYCMET